MSKYTPGPWEIERYSDGLIQIVGNARIVSDDEEIVTTVVEAVARGDEANARLIAAAPELLEALQAVIDYGSMTGAEWVAEQALAAIAKATA
ncbi:hypothetical protein [Pseudomonas aeruginosa]|uniref:hypothetical protein n=1 Tax=Pseudomonas aeruginosa TaxID=287 RepID=UPI000EB56F38|nr:hypothetical protein [Pseudomonas aeruginosa]MBF3102341.1 hypothetical protein [Pseudomonas aeruginosa]RUG07304.1 hypothetical protein IPC824_27270 [Pseudomonas aeruginosa]HBP5172575.1 hypothetical protein [Pseudomonas aeruginosa]HCE7624609.1 hypothetical protein [Pseudomonas aeruginosa]HCL4076871.1 hypothetical protein [Pseudomonas aeruginosa]